MNKDENIINYLTPDFVYVPYENNSTFTFKANHKVLLYEEIASLKYTSFAYASGNIIGTSSVSSTNGASSALVIENDFKDKCIKSSCIINDNINYKRKESNAILKKYDLYKSFRNKKDLFITYNVSKTVKSDTYFFKNNIEIILESIDYLVNIYKLNKAYIIINDKDLINEINKYIGTYLNIELLQINEKKKEKLLNNTFSINYNVYQVYEIFNIVKYSKPLSNKYITVNHNHNSYIVNVKLGCNLYGLLSFLNIKDFKSVKVYGNNTIDAINNSIIIKDDFLVEIE